MKKPEIMKLKPNRVHKPFIGGKLIDLWEGNEGIDGHYGERWIASTVNATDGNGGDEGLSHVEESEDPVLLKEIVEADPIGMLGKAHRDQYGAELGVLVKAIDAYSRLLIQVHPDKKRAVDLFGSPYGKTEAWYIIGCREIDGIAPYILLGFKEGIEEDQYREWFEEQNIHALETCMHRIPVSEGDVFMISGGMPHALGSGCFLIEIQEPTDITVRSEIHAVSGELLPEKAVHQGLGYDRMFECFDFKGFSIEDLEETVRLKPTILDDTSAGQILSLIDHPYFSMRKVTVKGQMKLHRTGAFEIAVVLKGKGHISTDDHKLMISQSDECFIPNTVTEYQITPEEGNSLEMLICLPPVSNETQN